MGYTTLSYSLLGEKRHLRCDHILLVQAPRNTNPGLHLLLTVLCHLHIELPSLQSTEYSLVGTDE